MTEENILLKLKRLIWDPMDAWLFYAMLIIYIMSLFLLYSADGQDIGRLESKTMHTIIGFVLLWIIARIKPQTLAAFAPPAYILGVLLLLGVLAEPRYPHPTFRNHENSPADDGGLVFPTP